MAKIADQRRVEGLIKLAIAHGLTRLSVTEDGVEIERDPGPPPAPATEQARQGISRRRSVPRDPESVDAFLRARLGPGGKEGN